MIIKENHDKSLVLFEPEDMKERKYLETFPGFFREGLYFFTPNKHHIVYNLYTRLRKKIKNLKYTPYIKTLIDTQIPIKEIPSNFKFHTSPLKHQEIALRFAYTFGSIGLLLEPGLGKTKIVLDYIFLKKFKKNLIICPLALVYVWQDEAEKHRPELKVHIVKTTSWEDEYEGIRNADVVVLNYDKAVALEEVLSAYGFDFVGIDEGLIKNPSTERTKAITKIGYTVKNRMIMSGTLVNNSGLDVFAPIRFIEPSLIGKRYTDFKGRYAMVNQRNKNIILGVYDNPEIKSILHACSVVMTKAEWLKDLPGKHFHKCMVQLSDKQREVYHQLASNFLAVLPNGEELEVNNQLSLLIKLYQIANGFTYYVDNEEETFNELNGEEVKSKKKSPRKTYVFDEQPKIKELNALADDPKRLKGRRAIIWFNMGKECDLIEETLKARGEKYLVIRGGDKELGKKVREFNKDPSIRWLVAQSRTLNYGQTIMGDQEPTTEALPEFDAKVSDEVFYSLNFSLEMFLQQQDRIHRIGQTNECHYWMLLSNTSVEKRTQAGLAEKLECSRSFLEDIAKSAYLDFNLVK